MLCVENFVYLCFMQVTEYQTIYVGEQGFEAHHFERLRQWNDNLPQKNRYFSVSYNGITFKHFVGAIQVGTLTIEILPKGEGDLQKVLLPMLQICRKIPVERVSPALLSYQSMTLLDVYVAFFLKELEILLHRGLIKKYKQTEGNLYTLKGKIKFDKHLAYNAVHQARFYTTHQIYDKQNIPNQILAKALHTVAQTTQNPLLTDQIQRLQVSFPAMKDLQVTADTFQKLPQTRQLLAYQTALKLAKLILLKFSPDVRGGRQGVWALLFDMNKLFETYIAQNLRQHLSEQYEVETQVNRNFWHTKDLKNLKLSLKPDLLLTCRTTQKRIILDTKWKVPAGGKPNSTDMYQLFAYSQHFKASQSYLIYPTAGKSHFVEGQFAPPNEKTHCGLFFVNILDENGNLRREAILNVASIT